MKPNSQGAAALQIGCLIASALPCLAPSVIAQGAWRHIGPPGALREVEYDASRDQVVAFGFSAPSTTWTLDENGWRGAGEQSGILMAYDSTRRQIVMFNGSTWTWNGFSWALASTQGPRRDAFARMVYDSARDRVVMHGGADPVSGTRFNDTWEWDGRAWSLVSTSGPTLSGFSATFDSVRNRVVIHGGFSGFANGSHVQSTTTWEWDGQTWTAAATNGPSIRRWGAMAFDSQRGVTVALSSRTAFTPEGVWTWDGTTWSQQGTLPTFETPMIVYDPSRGVIRGFSAGVELQWGGAQWSVAGSQPPDDIQDEPHCYDSTRDQLVLAGTANYSTYTYQWAGGSWSVSPSTLPSRYRSAQMAFDAATGRCVLFGGDILEGNDTWEWNGANWNQLTPPSLPSARTGHRMATNPNGGVMMFGGESSATLQSDTWVWDGQRWTQRTSANSPTPRRGHAVAYDSGRGRVVMFGGSGPGVSNATWEWDGTNWTALQAAGPSARLDHRMTYDQARGVTLLHGGRDLNGTYLDDLWEWDGREWVERSIAGFESRDGALLFFDEASDRVVTIGGRLPPSSRGDSSVRELLIDRIGVGCGNDMAELALADDRPEIGTAISATATWLPANAPTSGLIALDLFRPGIPLDFLRAPECVLRTRQVLVAQSMTTPLPATPSSTMRIPIPPDPALAGLRVYCQVVSVGPTFNRYPVTLTNAAVARLR